ncbi:SgcJ/EcaC family oxidoreductase [Streptomyces sp. NPDC053474]|uniref:SgcJ/EcaC family oxidoreductase n=1 Tax=Streptomyces sp. NPDC053474 TaxID=3365704 RepID=UPI0037D48BFF
MKPQVTGVAVSAQDVAAIVTLVAEVEHAQQNALPDAYLELFRHDALWSAPYSSPLTGLDEIAAFARRMLPGTAGQPLTWAYEVESVQFIRSDIAAVKIRQRPVTRDGERLDDLLRRPVDGSPRTGCRGPSEAVRRWAALVTAHPGEAPDTALYVMAKTDGRWRIAVAQNTTAIEADTLTPA